MIWVTLFQATLAPPVSGKMFKGLCVCYTVVLCTFYSVAISGYWAFGNKVSPTVFSNFDPSGRPDLFPLWFLFMSNMFVLLQLSAVAMVSYIQTIEEKRNFLDQCNHSSDFFDHEHAGMHCSCASALPRCPHL